MEILLKVGAWVTIVFFLIYIFVSSQDVGKERKPQSYGSWILGALIWIFLNLSK